MNKVINTVVVALFIIAGLAYLGLEIMNSYHKYTDTTLVEQQGDNCTVIKHKLVYDTVEVIKPTTIVYYDTIAVQSDDILIASLIQSDLLDWFGLIFFFSAISIFLSVIIGIIMMADSDDTTAGLGTYWFTYNLIIFILLVYNFIYYL